jgi:predicted YcjX-like family ATPase
VIRLAVTGLSRAGKTVFITSLIQNLLALGQGRNTLPLISRRLGTSGGSRLQSVRVVPAGVQTLPHFDFAEKLADLSADQPSWPPRTEDLAEISIELEIARGSMLGKRFGSRRLRLDILDYPGEWLLDLPLLQQSFADWSRQTIARLRQEPRRQLAQAFLDFHDNTVHPDDPAEDATIRRGYRLYREAIQACRSQLGLRYLQPGRFLCPGPRGDAPYMWFFPQFPGPAVPRVGSAAALLRDRFEAYKREVRDSFFDSYFRSFSRQIVLVDVLGALHAGQASFEDTRHAIADIARGLRDGWGFWSRQRRQVLSEHVGQGAQLAGAQLTRRGSPAIGIPLNLAASVLSGFVAPRAIERIAFVATKADHVPAMSRDNLRNLLQAMVKPAADGAGREVGDAKTAVSYHVAASILSTMDGTAPLGGRNVEVVLGVVMGEEIRRPFYAGSVPSNIPPASFWTDRYFEMPVFRPPRIDPSGTLGIPHLGLDEVLDSVIGDLL